MQIAFIGLGHMGAPMAINLHKAGHAVRAFDLSADVIPFLGHEISDEVIDLVIQRLCTYVPVRTWRVALRSAPR